MNNTIYTFLFILITIFSSCSDCDKTNDTYKYIHISHIRRFDTSIQKVDPRYENISYDNYEMILLGGDLTEESSKSKETVQYLNNLFQLEDKNTLFAQGNHDNYHPEYFEEITQRPSFFSYYNKGITWLVLDSQEKSDWECHISGNQFNLIKNIVDTIKNSSHLIVMTHKLLWLANNPELNEHCGKGPYDWSSNYKVFNHGWHKNIRPLLEKVQSRGIQVICLAGDIGNNCSQFEERSKSGIYYLASGSNPNKKSPKALIFKHTPQSKQLTWNFISINKL